MADIFEELVPRLVLNTETDADSPDNETTYDGLRKLVEGFIMSMIATGVSGTVTGISTATLSDTGNFTTDQCNGWVVIITSGDAIGNFYTIDDTTTDTIVCTGDDLETDGVAIGDTYIVLYDFVSNADGHDHDDINSKAVGAIATGAVDQDAIANSAVGQGELKTTSSETTVNLASGSTDYYTAAIGGGYYAFGEQIKKSSDGTVEYKGLQDSSIGASYTRPKAVFNRSGGSTGTGYITVYYVQASGELHWVYFLMKNGEVMATWEQPDHPSFGLDIDLDHPFHFPFNGLKENECEIITVIPTMKQIEEIRKGQIKTGSFIDAFNEKFVINESKEADWPDIPVTVGFPKTYNGMIVDDWRFMPRFDKDGKRIKINPIQEVIKKPDNVTCLSIKEKR